MSKLQGTFIVEDMKVFSGVSANEVMGCHLHKIVQVPVQAHFHFSLFFLFWLKSGSFFQVLGESLHITYEYLAQETKVVSVVSRVEALEVENSKLKKDLIVAIEEANAMKEKLKVMGDDLKAERQLMVEKDNQLLVAKEKIKTIVAKAVEAF